MANGTIEITDNTGETRLLMPISNQLMRGAFPVYGDADPSDMIPMSDWDKQARIDGLANFVDTIDNQTSIGMCNPSDTAYCLKYTRRQQGLQHVQLSAGDLYRRICINGQDNGSNLVDAIRAVQVQPGGGGSGMCSTDLCPYLEWHRKMPRVEAEYKEFAVAEWEWAPTAEHLFSAAFKGFCSSIGILWGSSDNIDQDGWLPDTARGSIGGHAVMRCIPVWHPRRGWGLSGPNSWSPQWGAPLFGQPGGWMTISYTRLKQQERENFGWWICRSVVHSRPQGVLPTPPVAA